MVMSDLTLRGIHEPTRGRCVFLLFEVTAIDVSSFRWSADLGDGAVSEAISQLARDHAVCFLVVKVFDLLAVMVGGLSEAMAFYLLVVMACDLLVVTICGLVQVRNGVLEDFRQYLTCVNNVYVGESNLLSLELG